MVGTGCASEKISNGCTYVRSILLFGRKDSKRIKCTNVRWWRSRRSYESERFLILLRSMYDPLVTIGISQIYHFLFSILSQICERTLKKGWSVVQDSQRRIGPYAYYGDQWVSFDDSKQIRIKAELIKKLGLGGGMIWALDLDDFKNRCGCEPSPLLRTMNRVLRNYPEGPLCPVVSGWYLLSCFFLFFFSS